MAEITEEHIKFINALASSELANQNFDDAIMLVNVAKYLTACAQEKNGILFGPQEKKHVDSLIDLAVKKTQNKNFDEAMALLSVLKCFNASELEKKTEAKNETSLEIPETNTIKHTKNPSGVSSDYFYKLFSGNDLVKCSVAEQETPKKLTSSEIIEKVALAYFKSDLSGLEFVKNLTQGQIGRVIAYAKDNSSTVKEIVQKATSPVNISSQEDLVISIIAGIPYIYGTVDCSQGKMTINIIYYPTLLTDTTFEISTLILSKNKLVKFDSKTKKVTCEKFTITLLEESTFGINGPLKLLYQFS